MIRIKRNLIIRNPYTGETLCDEKNPIILEKMDFPDPVIKIAIEPKSKADLEKMGMGLNKLAQEDPSFGYSRDEETNQTVIEGMGESCQMTLITLSWAPGLR